MGKELEQRGSANAIYQRWIETYASEEFGAVVQEVLKLINSIAATLTEADQERVAAHFVMTSRFEYLFWDMGYRQQAWEV